MAEDSLASLDQLSDEQLKEELENRGLNTSGDRDELILRIEDYDQQDHIEQEEEHGEGDHGEDYYEDVETHEEENGEEEEKEDENDFVVWADDVDEMNDDEKKVKKEEERQGTEPQPEDEAEKASDELFGLDMAKDKDQLMLTWNGKKIVIPCKDEVSKELKSVSRQLNIIAFPVLTEDLFNETVSPLITSAINVSTELDDAGPGAPIKGYLRLKFGTLSEAKRAMEVLKGLATEERQITVQHFYDSDSEGHILSKVKGKINSKDSLSQRLLFVSNIPGEVTEEELKDHFIGCLRVINPTKEDQQQQNIGHVYVEYASESATSEALEKFKASTLKGQPIYVIKVINEKKESTGVLKDSLRKYWLEQVRLLEATDRSSKSSKEIADLDQKLHKHKKRIVTDNVKRQALLVPVPEDEQFELDPSMEEKEKEKEKRSSTSRRRSPVHSRRRSPPRRGRSSYRGQSKFSGSARRGGGTNPDALVNQLQHLVGVLSNKLPTDAPRYESYHDRDQRTYTDPRSRDRYAPYPSYHERDRFESKRFATDDYGPDRKRRADDGDYIRYNRSSNSDYRGFRGSGPSRW